MKCVKDRENSGVLFPLRRKFCSNLSLIKGKVHQINDNEMIYTFDYEID